VSVKPGLAQESLRIALVTYEYQELVNRDQASLDIFWLRDESLEDSDSLPDRDVLAQQIVDDLEAALEQFRAIANAIQSSAIEGTLQFETA